MIAPPARLGTATTSTCSLGATNMRVTLDFDTPLVYCHYVLAEALAVSVGRAIATAIASSWLGAVESKTEPKSYLEVIRIRVPRLFDQGHRERQFSVLADMLAQKLAPLIANELRGLEANEAEAAASCAVSVITEARIDPPDVLALSLDPRRLLSSIRESEQPFLDQVLLSEPGRALYELLVTESASYIVQVLRRLPEYDQQRDREILRREDEMRDLVEEILARLPERVSPGSEESEFELAYLRTVEGVLDEIRMYGVDLPPHVRRYKLSTAYVSLSFSEGPQTRSRDGVVPSAEDSEPVTEGGPLAESTSLNADRWLPELLEKGHNVLIRGDAGSGKTTMLHWLAVTAARRQFVADLEVMNGLVPFLVVLRDYGAVDLPVPPNFVDSVAKSLRDDMPQGWVAKVLAEGRGLLLIDGLDELSENRFDDVLTWLRELMTRFENLRVVVTARSAAIPPDWLASLHFLSTEIEPMTLREIDLFVDHWHDAVAQSGFESDDRDSLKSLLRATPSVRSLATSPLMCSVICGLHHARAKQLPRDRMELYRIALEMLVDRRDIERDIPADVDLALSFPQKREILQDAAWHMQTCDRVVIARDEFVERIDWKIKSMPGVSADGRTIARHLIVRSGLLREPQDGDVDFVHRTFLEYLAAAEAMEQGAIARLVDSAHLQNWREVIVMAAGHAQREQATALVRKLLARGENDPEHGAIINLVAVASLTSVVAIDPGLVRQIDGTLQSLVPPRSLSDARALASAKELVVPHLRPPKRRARVAVTAACVRTLGLVGGDEALDVLSEYGSDTRKTVIRELLRAWRQFDAGEYAQKVLRDSPLTNNALSVDDPSTLVGLKFLNNLRRLTLVGIDVGKGGDNRREIESLSGLETLRFWDTPSLTDLGITHSLDSLVELSVYRCDKLQSINNIRADTVRSLAIYFGSPDLNEFIPNKSPVILQDLILIGTNFESTDFAPHTPALVRLQMDGPALRNLDGLEALNQLRLLNIRTMKEIDLSPIGKVETLQSLVLARSIVDSFDWIVDSSLPSTLKILRCSNSEISDYSGISFLEKLETIDLRGNHTLYDIGFLSDCRKLKRVLLDGTHITDITPLLGLKGAAIVVPESVALDELDPTFRKDNVVSRAARRGTLPA